MDKHNKNNKIYTNGRANQPKKRDGNSSGNSLKNITFLNLCVYIMTTIGTIQCLYDYFTYGSCSYCMAILCIYNILALTNAHLEDIHRDYIRNHLLTSQNLNFVIIILMFVVLYPDGIVP
jgi:hypothetical protein